MDSRTETLLYSLGRHLENRRTVAMPVTVRPIPDGPLQVKGEVEVQDTQGNVIPG